MSTTMSPELQKAQEIAATARVLAVFALTVIAINVLSKVGVRIGTGLFEDAMSWRELIQDVGPILISLLPTFLFFESINQLRRALKLYSDGEFFNAAAAVRVAEAGDYAIGAMAATILVVPNLTEWVAHRGGFHMRFESEFIGMIAFALFVSAVGRILAAATQLKSENDSFV